MTEEQVKQIVVDMIENGELEIGVENKTISVPSFRNGSLEMIKDINLTFSMTHNKNGYNKRIFEQTIKI